MMSVEPMAQKEKPHVVDYYRNSIRTMANRILRPESSLQCSAHRKCCSHTACYCCDSYCLEIVRDYINYPFCRFVSTFAKLTQTYRATVLNLYVIDSTLK